MPADGRFGGHIVSGHIDGTGSVLSQRREDNAVWVTIKTPAPLLRYIVEKGSIAIDGVSLTVAAVTDTDFRSPSFRTPARRPFCSAKPGEPVNLECDVIGKYVEKMLHAAQIQRYYDGFSCTTRILTEVFSYGISVQYS